MTYALWTVQVLLALIFLFIGGALALMVRNSRRQSWNPECFALLLWRCEKII